MITLNLFELNLLDSFLEINVIYFGQNNKKVGKFSCLKYFFI